MIVVVPGSGKTKITRESGFYGLRKNATSIGFACLIWNKAGCGNSEGTFDYNQPVQNSADEVTAAISAATVRKIPGSEKSGLWGISRAGWICPLVAGQYPVAFWISVSGTDDKENFGYLLEKNFLIEGRSKAQTEMLMAEWRKGIEIARKGGTFNENLKATENLRKDTFYQYINDGKEPTREGFLSWQKKIQTGEIIIDTATELTVYVRNFDKILERVSCPVLAIFGEKDCQVDWQKTQALYKRTIGKNPKTSLTIKTLPDCNHSMLSCKTGGYREDLSNADICPGYYDAMLSWLEKIY